LTKGRLFSEKPSKSIDLQSLQLKILKIKIPIYANGPPLVKI
jgi:hypothetical protein